MSKRCTANDLKYGFDDDTLLTLKTIDPTGSQCKYLDWIFKQYKNKQFLLEDSKTVRDDLILYNDNKGKFEGNEKDINSLTYSTLKILLADKFSSSLEFNQDNTAGLDVTVLYEGPYGKLYIPLTEEASCRLGSGTKWCTAAKENNMFNRYFKDGPLYIWIDNNWNSELYKGYQGGTVPIRRSKKFQFHFETRQYMDELDNDINENLLHYFVTEHPIISQLFQRYVDSIKDDQVKFSMYIVDTPNYKELLKKYVTTSLDNEFTFVNGLASGDLDEIHYGSMKPEIKEIVDKYKTYMEDKGTALDIAKYVFNILGDEQENMDEYIVGHYDREAEIAIIIEEDWKTLHKFHKFPLEDEIKVLMDEKYNIRYLMSHENLKRSNIQIPQSSNSVVSQAILHRVKGLSVIDLYKVSPEVALYYTIYVLRCRNLYLESMGLSSIDKLNTIYKKLFIYGHSIPTNAYELTPKDIDLIYGNEDKFFATDANEKDNPYDSTVLLDVYKAYMKKYQRSELIEKYLIKYCDKNSYLLLYLEIYVFETKLSNALGYINPNIDDSLSNYNKDIFEPGNIVTRGIASILMNIKMTGYDDSKISLLAGKLHSITYVYNCQKELGKLDFYLNRDALFLLYGKLSTESCVHFLLFPYLFNERSPELESMYESHVQKGVLESRISSILFQYYWLKFLGTRMDTFDVDFIIYRDNYKGTIPSQEELFVQSTDYLDTRVVG